MKRSHIFTFAVLGALALRATALEKNDFNARYAEKFLVVTRAGISTGICPNHPGAASGVVVDLDYNRATVRRSKLGRFLDMDPHPSGNACQGALSQAVEVGEVLTIRHLAAIHRGELKMLVENTSPHAVTRGVGAFQHESLERGQVILIVPARDYDTAAAILDRWVKPFNSQEEAAKFGNTASGATVKEVKIGMTPAEVEQALGVPETRVDLGEKVLYKYKDMTVEFRSGKVADVR